MTCVSPIGDGCGTPTLSSGVIAVVALGSLAFLPFTEQYARESVPREHWGSPLFRRTDRILTAVWGGVFPVTALLGLLALHLGSGGTGSTG